ncbi:MAG: hypothetical protein E7045_02480 [Lentisphaerae bacterium]|nr:hypothetical protein [Lentisphaerota bacterium]
MKFYYFNSTHWDREWYQPFQEFRKYLVDTTAEMLDIFKNVPEFEKFTFDGQTIVLEDVTEIHPEWRNELVKLVSDGKLNVGPWYVMPDEFLCSGEAMMRNFSVGHQVADEFGGKVWKSGYICDIFGHIAQMPQIMAGFGLKGAVVWRGFPDDKGGKGIWESPDGTRIPALRLHPFCGYGKFSLEVRGWWNEKLDEKSMKERLSKWIEENRYFFGDTFVLSDALDHAVPSADTPKLLKWVKELYPDAEVVHSDFLDFFAEEFENSAELPVFAGEQIYTASGNQNNGYQIPYTLSSRYDVKRANDLCQNTLELLIEPELARRAADGDTKSLPFLRCLWKTLLKNHPHDSICGCSIDTVHRQVLGRFEEVQQLASRMEEEFRFIERKRISGKTIAEELKGSDGIDKSDKEIAEDGNYTLRLYNPLPYAMDGVRELTIAFPAITPYVSRPEGMFIKDTINAFRLFDADGAELPYVIKALKRNQVRPFCRQDVRRYDVYTVAAKCRLAPSSWTSISIKPSKFQVRNWGSLVTGVRSAENGIIKLEISNDGTFSVTDLRSGRVYSNQNEYLIDRDCGDGWYFVSPAVNPTVCGTNDVTVRLLHNMSDYAEFEVIKRYRVAKELVWKGSINESYVGAFESEEYTTLEIKSYISLSSSSDSVNVRTVVDNTLCDARVRLRVPTGIAGKYFTSQVAAILENNMGRPHGDASINIDEPEVIERNFDGIAGKRDEKGGIAFISKAGLHEVAGIPYSSDEALAVTLWRSFRRTVMTNGEIDGQLLKRLEFNYSLKCFDAGVSYSDMVRDMQKMRADVPSDIIKSCAVKEKDAAPFFEVSGDLLLSACKPAWNAEENTIILRLVNYSDVEVSSEVKFDRNIRSVMLCRLDESEISDVEFSANTFKATAGKWAYVTYKIAF